MPYLLIILFLLSAILAFDSYFFVFLLTGQVAAYGLALMNKWVTVNQSDPSRNSLLNTVFNNKIARLVSYLCQGHLMGFLGSASYLQNSFKQHVLGITPQQRWHKVEITKK